MNFVTPGVHFNMDIEDEWMRYFSYFGWTSISCSLRGSWQTSDKVKAFFVLLYTLIEGCRLCYVWTLQDLESSLKFLAIYHPLGLVGRMFSLASGIVLLEYVVLQLILWFDQTSLFKLGLYTMTDDERRSYVKESKLVLLFSYWPMKFSARFFQFIVISCGLYYIYYFSFSLGTLFLSICAIILQVINIEHLADVYVFYWLWFIASRKLFYSISSLFRENSPLSLELTRYGQVWFHFKMLNQLSQKLGTTCFIFGCLHNTGLSLMIYSLSKSEGFPVIFLVLSIWTTIMIFIYRLLYFIGAATPLQQSIRMRDRIYRLLFHKELLSWKHQKHLLSIIKTQDRKQTKIALTTIDGRLLETKMLGQHITYSARVLVLLFKVMKS